MLVTRIIFEKNFSLLYKAFFDLEQKSATYCSAVAKQMSDHSNLDAFCPELSFFHNSQRLGSKTGSHYLFQNKGFNVQRVPRAAVHKTGERNQARKVQS